MWTESEGERGTQEREETVSGAAEAERNLVTTRTPGLVDEHIAWSQETPCLIATVQTQRTLQLFGSVSQLPVLLHHNLRIQGRSSVPCMAKEANQHAP